MRILKPKYVPKAKMWCVTIFKELHQTKGTKTHSQTQEWFSTEEEANNYINKQQEG